MGKERGGNVLQDIDWSRIESKYFTVIPDVEYIVEVVDFKIVKKDFHKPNEEPEDGLSMHIASCSANGVEEFYSRPKELFTKSVAFVQQVKPILQRAVMERRDSVWLTFKRSKNNNWTVFSWEPKMTPRVERFPRVQSQ